MKLAPGDSLQGEPGTMLYLTSGMQQRVSYEGCCERLCSGEDCFVLNLVASRSSRCIVRGALPQLSHGKGCAR